MCTLLLRAALHKDHFSKITTWLAFIPYFWKPSCFLRLPLLPLFLSPPLLLLLLLSHLCHVLVFICWFCSSSFSPCVKKKKWKAENRMSERGKKGRRQKRCRHVGEITVCSVETNLFFLFLFFCTGSYGLQQKPQNSIHIHHSLHTKPHDSAELLYTNVILSQHDKRNSGDQPQAAA